MRLRRLFFILSLLLWTVVTVITINSVTSAWSHFSKSKDGMQAIEQLQALLIVAEMASRERGPANGVLGDDFPPDPLKKELLNKARNKTDESFTKLLQMLKDSNESVYITSKLAKEQLERARQAVDTEASKKRDDRDASKIRSAVNRMISVIDGLSPASLILTNDASASFPNTTDTLQAAIQAAALREYAGQLGSQLTAALTTREKLNIDELMVINHLRGRIEQLNEQLNARAATFKDHHVVQAYIEIMTERYFKSAIPFVEEQVTIGLIDGNYNVDTAQFAARYVPDMDSIVTLRDILMNDSINSANQNLKATTISAIKTILGAALLLVLLVINLWLLHHRVIKPLTKTTNLIVTIANGQLNVNIPSSKYKDEVNDMLGAISVLRNNSIARRKAEETIRQMAFYDPLTELPNRRLLKDRLSQAMSRAKRIGTKGAVLFIDLDKFKPVNDIHGHEVGDWLLKQVAARMMSQLREEDTAARIGGDEFIVLINDITDEESALTVAEKIRIQIQEAFVTDNNINIRISASIGLVIFPDHSDNIHELLRFGDDAMYQAKNNGRNDIVVFDPSENV